MSTKRFDLKGHFKAGMIPLEEHFKSLIESALIQTDDGLEKLPNQSLSLKLNENKENLKNDWLRFHLNNPKEAEWVVSGNINEKDNTQTDSFYLKDKNDKTRISFPQHSLRAGLGIINPVSALHLKLEKETDGITFESLDGKDLWQISMRESQKFNSKTDADEATLLKREKNNSRIVISSLSQAGRDDSRPPLCLSEDGKAGFGTDEPEHQVDIQGDSSLRIGSWVIFENEGDLEFVCDGRPVIKLTPSGKWKSENNSDMEESTEEELQLEKNPIG